MSKKEYKHRIALKGVTNSYQIPGLTTTVKATKGNDDSDKNGWYFYFVSEHKSQEFSEALTGNALLKRIGGHKPEEKVVGAFYVNGGPWLYWDLRELRELTPTFHHTWGIWYAWRVLLWMERVTKWSRCRKSA